MSFRTLDGVAVRGRRVLLRADLNVPTHRGQIGDLTRIERLSPTIRELSQAGARVVIISHFDRPRGRRVESMSLRPVAEALGKVLGRPVAFAANCIGPETRAAVAGLRDGEVIVLENTRFHSEEENNDRIFARELAQNGEIFVNDAFSAAHRAHASTEGVAHILPSYAGRLMQTELNALKMALGSPIRPVMAIIGGSKVSTKIELLMNLVAHIDTVVIGGAMANTFLAAEGNDVAWSMQEPELHGVARGIMARANELGCKIALPMDLVVALEFRANAPHRVVPSTKVPPNMMALDIGPATIMDVVRRMLRMRTVIWNGPMGAFETPPFDRGTIAVAHAVAEATTRGRLRSIAGGGDTMAALRHAGVADRFSYVSLGGGAFLEFLEGKTLPGVAALDPVNGPR